MTDITERIARAIWEAERRYVVKGTTDDEWDGPPYRAPWFIIDSSMAEPEVNWPGDLVAKFQDGGRAWQHKNDLVAKAALQALTDSGIPIDKLISGEYVAVPVTIDDEHCHCLHGECVWEKCPEDLTGDPCSLPDPICPLCGSKSRHWSKKITAHKEQTPTFGN